MAPDTDTDTALATDTMAAAMSLPTMAGITAAGMRRPTMAVATTAVPWSAIAAWSVRPTPTMAARGSMVRDTIAPTTVAGNHENKGRPKWRPFFERRVRG